jgi:multimeric flavodoxin WrbA
MTKVLVLSATPRRGGNSEILAEQVVAGARAAGAVVEKIRLADLRIEPCDACDACQGERETACLIADDMEGFYPKLLQADALVFAAPIYFFGACAQMKCFLDRTYALGGGGDWTAMAGKRAGVILTYGDSNPLYSGVANAYGMFRDACRFLAMELVECIQASCGEAGEVRKNAAAMAAAEELGRRLA